MIPVSLPILISPARYYLTNPLYLSPVLGEVQSVGLFAAVAGAAPAGQRHEVVLELVVKLVLAGQAPHTDRVCRLGRP